MAKTLTYITAPTVFVEWYTTGRLGGSDSSGLHEAAIVRAKVEKQGESLIVVKKWTANGAPQVVERIVGNEYLRLVEKYGKEKVTDLVVKEAFYHIQKENVRSLILNQGKRLDGRSFTQVRALGGEVGIIPRAHGSALFSRPR